MIDDYNKSTNSDHDTENPGPYSESQSGTPYNEPTGGEHGNPGNSERLSLAIRLWQWLCSWYSDPFRQRSNVAEKVTVFVTVILAIIGGLQYSVYRQRKKIMEGSGEQTQELIDAADKQARAAASFSATALQINQAIQNGVTDLGRPYIFVAPIEPGGVLL